MTNVINIKPIETQYNGHRFRSRLEARWAVFFDALGVRWIYEPEGLLIDGKPYLPDFLLPDLGYLIEIKPATDNEWPSHLLFDWLNKSDDAPFALVPFPGFGNLQFVLIKGTPGRGTYEGYVLGDDGHIWCECPRCGSLGIQYEGRAARNGHSANCVLGISARSGGIGSDRRRGHSAERIITAGRLASSARFEHGESPC